MKHNRPGDKELIALHCNVMRNYKRLCYLKKSKSLNMARGVHFTRPSGRWQILGELETIW